MKPEEERKIADYYQALEEDQRQFAIEEFMKFFKSQIRKGITGVGHGGFVNYHKGTFQAYI